MKKLGAVLAILAVVALVGCGSGTAGGAAKSGGGAAPFKVDLSKLTALQSEAGKNSETVLAGKYTTFQGVRNKTPFAKNYDDFLFLLTPDVLPPDLSKYQRLTLTVKYFGKDGTEMAQGDGMAMVSFIYDLKAKDIRGPQMGPGPNTPVKEMNLGGYSGLINKDRGIRVTFDKAPQGLLLQNSNPGVAFIELTSLVFHNGDYSSQ